MKKIKQIAWLELGQMFFSPIAWLLMIVLFIQMSLLILPALNDLNALRNSTFLTSSIFTNPEQMGVLQRIIGHLYLYIPLVTMGIMSREVSSGSIKLLYSSPLKLSHIVYGKFAAMALFNLVLVTIIGSFAFAGSYFIPHFDYPLILAALLAIYLLLNTYAAIGIFVSSLTSYQTVAAISTFVVLSIMNYIGRLGQEYDFIRDLTHSLSMPSRAERMILGLLSSRDIIYYLTISGMFIAFTITKLTFERKPISSLRQVTRYTGIVTICLLVTYLSSRPSLIGYVDVTATNTNTITKTNQDLLARLGDTTLEITTYVNGMDDSYYRSPPKERIASIGRWEPYLRFNPNIKLKWVYYYDTVADAGQYLRENNIPFNTFVTSMASIHQLDLSKFINPLELKKMVDLSNEEKFLIMQVKYKDKATFLRAFPAPDSKFWPGEAEIGAAFKRLLMPPPKILFATDGYQRSINKKGDRDYKELFNNKFGRSSLVNQGFDVDTISLERQDIPSDIATLVIADMRVAFAPGTVQKLQRYIDAGGNLLIAGEPGKQQVVNPVLQLLGVQMASGTIIQQSKDYSYDLAIPKLAPGAVALDKMLQPYYQNGYTVSMPHAGALQVDTVNSFVVHPLLTTDPQVSWKKEGKFVIDSAAVTFDPLQGDLKSSFPTNVMMSRTHKGKLQRIIVSADADFMSNGELSRNNLIAINYNYAKSIFKWFAYGEFPIDDSRPLSKDNTVTLTKESVNIIQMICYVFIPGLLALGATIVLLRRKRK